MKRIAEANNYCNGPGPHAMCLAISSSSGTIVVQSVVAVDFDSCFY